MGDGVDDLPVGQHHTDEFGKSNQQTHRAHFCRTFAEALGPVIRSEAEDQAQEHGVHKAQADQPLKSPAGLGGDDSVDDKGNQHHNHADDG